MATEGVLTRIVSVLVALADPEREFHFSRNVSFVPVERGSTGGFPKGTPRKAGRS